MKIRVSQRYEANGRACERSLELEIQQWNYVGPEEIEHEFIERKIAMLCQQIQTVPYTEAK